MLKFWKINLDFFYKKNYPIQWISIYILDSEQRANPSLKNDHSNMNLSMVFYIVGFRTMGCVYLYNRVYM